MIGPTLWSISPSWICAKILGQESPGCTSVQVFLPLQHVWRYLECSYNTTMLNIYALFHQTLLHWCNLTEHWPVRPKSLKGKHRMCTDGMCPPLLVDTEVAKATVFFWLQLNLCFSAVICLFIVVCIKINSILCYLFYLLGFTASSHTEILLNYQNFKAVIALMTYSKYSLLKVLVV